MGNAVRRCYSSRGKAPHPPGVPGSLSDGATGGLGGTSSHGSSLFSSESIHVLTGLCVVYIPG